MQTDGAHLFVLEGHNIEPGMPIIRRTAVRGVVEREGRLLLILAADGRYKLPGGGMEKGEDRLDTLRREMMEETGMQADTRSAVYLGSVMERRRDYRGGYSGFEQCSYYYRVDCVGEIGTTAMSENELRAGYHPVWATAEEAIAANLRLMDRPWFERDTRFLQWLTGKGTSWESD